MELIKQLREKTGAGMVDCKKALEETGDDIEKAIEVLRKKGIAKAAKRGERETSEGVIKLKTNEDLSAGFMVQVSAETDFVAKNEKFQSFADELLKVVESKRPSNLKNLLKEQMSEGNVEETLGNLSGTIGEKMEIKNFAILEAEGALVSAYSHMNGRIGVLVAFDKKVEADLARDVAMHVAASNPSYLKPEEVPSAEIEKEKEIYAEQLKKEGKPAQIIEKIMVGKVNKYYEDVCLLKQEYIKDDKQKVEQVLGDATITKFIRFSL